MHRRLNRAFNHVDELLHARTESRAPGAASTHTAMTTEAALIDSALRMWKLNVDRADKFFGALSETQLLREIAPGRNRLIYLWGHLAAVSDAMIPLLGFGRRLHPELDPMFLSNPDRSQPELLSGAALKQVWDEINESLWSDFSRLSPAEWTQRHTAVSEEDFRGEPHRNRFTILVGRTAHLASHLGQAMLADSSA
jgi:hypothetical protein